MTLEAKAHADMAADYAKLADEALLGAMESRRKTATEMATVHALVAIALNLNN